MRPPVLFQPPLFSFAGGAKTSNKFGLPVVFFALIGFSVPTLSLAAFFTGTQDPAYLTAVSLSPVTATAEIKILLAMSTADTYKRE